MPGHKRKDRKSSSASDCTTSQSAESSPENQPHKKKPNMSQGIMDILEKVMERLDILDKKMTDLASEFKTVKPEMKRMEERITKVKDSTDLLWKRMLEKTVVVHGIPDQPEETVENTREKVKEVIVKLGLSESIVASVRKMGYYRPQKNRLVEVNLTSVDDKKLLMTTKRKLREITNMKKVYINPARTPKETENFNHLRDFLTNQKAIDYIKKYKTKYKFIGSQILEIDSMEEKGKFHVGREGLVEAWIEKGPSTKKTGDGAVS